MRRTQTRPRGRFGRLLVATLILASVPALLPSVAAARSTQQALADAKAKLAQLNTQLDRLVEQYDQARTILQQTQSSLAQARSDAAAAQAKADRAKAILSARAASAYETTGSTLDALLGATSFSQLSDRIAFLGTVAQNDVDVANQAQVAKQQAQTSAARLSALLQQRTAALKKLVASKQQIQAGISQEQAIVSKFQKQLAAEQAAARARALAAKKAAQSNPAPAGPPPGSGSGGGGGPPPPPASGAAAAVRAAYSVLGVPYQWGGSNPQTGFDCSGLTMWSWAHAGVSMPHSAGMQYAMFPHVPASDLQPGDLVFFYTPISHVGIYVGGGMMIHAPHTGSFVSLVPLSYEPGFVGAARP